MSSDGQPGLGAQPVQQAQDPGLHGHVERGRRLVGDQQPSGSQASAIAMAIRCRIPPENWCG